MINYSRAIKCIIRNIYWYIFSTGILDTNPDTYLQALSQHDNITVNSYRIKKESLH